MRNRAGRDRKGSIGKLNRPSSEVAGPLLPVGWLFLKHDGREQLLSGRCVGLLRSGAEGTRKPGERHKSDDLSYASAIKFSIRGFYKLYYYAFRTPLSRDIKPPAAPRAGPGRGRSKSGLCKRVWGSNFRGLGQSTCCALPEDGNCQGRCVSANRSKATNCPSARWGVIALITGHSWLIHYSDAQPRFAIAAQLVGPNPMIKRALVGCFLPLTAPCLLLSAINACSRHALQGFGDAFR